MTASPTKRFFGGLLMAMGGLIAGLCGLCTGGFMVIFLIDVFGNSPGFGNPFMAVLVPLMWGAIPIGLGLALLFIGRFIYRT